MVLWRSIYKWLCLVCDQINLVFVYLRSMGYGLWWWSYWQSVCSKDIIDGVIIHKSISLPFFLNSSWSGRVYARLISPNYCIGVVMDEFFPSLVLYRVSFASVHIIISSLYPNLRFINYCRPIMVWCLGLYLSIPSFSLMYIYFF